MEIITLKAFFHNKMECIGIFFRQNANRLADGITISYNSLSAAVPADEYNLAFCCYLHL
jgi:hypothetical protein